MFIQKKLLERSLSTTYLLNCGLVILILFQNDVIVIVVIGNQNADKTQKIKFKMM